MKWDFECSKCDAEILCFVHPPLPPLTWDWDAETDTWTCGICSFEERERERNESKTKNY